MELHLFCLKNPDVDINAHLAKTSSNFKTYIKSGLKKASKSHPGAEKGEKLNALKRFFRTCCAAL
jgi:hypothetical protein